MLSTKLLAKASRAPIEEKPLAFADRFLPRAEYYRAPPPHHHRPCSTTRYSLHPMRKTAAWTLLLALAALASSISSLEAAATESSATSTNPSSSSSPSPAPAKPAEEAADPSTDHSKHNHAAHNHGAGASASASSSPPVQLPDQPCFSDPTAAECASFTRPKGSWLPELTGLCEAMDYMPGCTLWRECQVSR